jgi:hypothetical protein
LRDADKPSLRNEVHLLLGQLVHAYARFDFNMGLQLAWLGPYRGVAVQDLLDGKIPFGQRLKALRRLVLEVFASENEHAHVAFKRLFQRIERAQAMRNDYVHGRWGFPVRAEWPDPEFEFVPLSWEMDPLKQAPPLRLRLSKLAREVAAIELLFDEYRDLERMFMSTARPPLTWEIQQTSASSTSS